MMERQHGYSATGKSDVLTAMAHIGAYVSLRKHDTFAFPGSAGRINNSGHCIRIGFRITKGGFFFDQRAQISHGNGTNISISGGTVYAIGGDAGAGIGGGLANGLGGTASGITIIGSSVVSVSGGGDYVPPYSYSHYGAGSAIGTGGHGNEVSGDGTTHTHRGT